jgi:hypothetical protein
MNAPSPLKVYRTNFGDAVIMLLLVVLICLHWDSHKCDSPRLSDSGGVVHYATRTGAYSVSN